MNTSNPFEALFNYATIGIIVTDAQGNIVNFNAKAAQDFDYSKEEVVGKPVEILLPHSLGEKHRAHRKKFLCASIAALNGRGQRFIWQKKRWQCISCGSKS